MLTDKKKLQQCIEDWIDSEQCRFQSCRINGQCHSDHNFKSSNPNLLTPPSREFVKQMENKTISTKSVHCLVLPFPAHGHTNPMLEFSKLLQHQEGVKVTLVTTLSNYNNIPKLPPNSNITIETISDGFDKGGVAEAKSFIIYLNKFWQVGPQSLADLINNLNARSNDHVDCIIYDSFMPWCLDVAKKFGIVGASFLTQNLAMNSIYYHVHLGKLKPPFAEQEISLPALSQLQHRDMPCFYFTYEKDPTFLDLVVAQFSNIHKADWILCNFS